MFQDGSTSIPKDIYESKEIIFVSPHLDDAVLSCGDFIYKLASNNKTVKVISVFTEASPPPYSEAAIRHLKLTGYNNAFDLFKKRRTNDIAAVKLLGADYLHLGFIDAAWRKVRGKLLYTNDKLLFSGKPRVDDKETQTQIYLKLHKFIKQKSVCFFPMGIGGHVDHLLVKKTSEFFPNKKYYWEDFPYNRASKMKFTDKLRFNKNFVVKSKKNNKKKEAIKKYVTETNVLFSDKVIPFKDETYWSNN